MDSTIAWGGSYPIYFFCLPKSSSGSATEYLKAAQSSLKIPVRSYKCILKRGESER